MAKFGLIALGFLIGTRIHLFNTLEIILVGLNSDIGVEDRIQILVLQSLVVSMKHLLYFLIPFVLLAWYHQKPKLLLPGYKKWMIGVLVGIVIPTMYQFLTIHQYQDLFLITEVVPLLMVALVYAIFILFHKQLSPSKG